MRWRCSSGSSGAGSSEPSLQRPASKATSPSRSHGRGRSDVSAALVAAVVRIRRGGVGIGAGFLAAPGKVLTCAHVVAEALNLKGTPTEPPSAELELDFPLLRWCPVL